MLGSAYLVLSPPKNPNCTYFIFTIILTTSCLFFLLCFLVPTQAHLVMVISMFGIGLARAGAPLPYILAYKNLNRDEDIMALNIWQGLIVCGYIYAYLLDSLIRIKLQLHWTTYIMIYSGIYFLTGLFTFLLVEKVELSEIEGDSEQSVCE